MSDDASLSHMEVVAAITSIAARVFGVLIPAEMMVRMGPDALESALKHDVIEILKHRKLGSEYIHEAANWSPIMQGAGERLKLAMIALVLAIYE